MKRLKHSFQFAFKGLFVILREQNIRIHLCFLFYLIIAGCILDITAMEWMIISICVGLVISAECFNTAIELLCDEVCREYSKAIGQIKDIAAGAVLALAIASSIAGGIIFFQKDRLHQLYSYVSQNPPFAILLIVSFTAWLLFIFGLRIDKTE